MPPPRAPVDDHSITLSGSAELVTEFFSFGVNTLLFQRGIYPPETFRRVSKYGMTMLVSADPAVQKYLQSVLAQMRTWLSLGKLDRVVVVIASVATGTVLERWAFDVGTDKSSAQATQPSSVTPLQPIVENADNVASAPDSTNPSPAKSTKTRKQIMAEIQAVVRQITASVTFLPLLDEACAFDMLIYTNKDVTTPTKWEESGPRNVIDKEDVQLRSFSTSIHNVDACVSYARDDS